MPVETRLKKTVPHRKSIFKPFINFSLVFFIVISYPRYLFAGKLLTVHKKFILYKKWDIWAAYFLDKIIYQQPSCLKLLLVQYALPNLRV